MATRPMTVLFAIDSLGAGGAERSLVEMLPALASRDVEGHVAVFTHRETGVAHLVDPDRLHVLTGPSRPRQMLELRRLARRLDVDVVHTTLFTADVFGRTALAGLGVPVVTSLVNMAYEPQRGAVDRAVHPLKLRAARIAETLTGHLFADEFHAITRAVADAAVTSLHLRADDITVVPRGRDEARLGRRSHQRRIAARTALGIDESTTVVLSAGRHEPQKSHETLIDAFARSHRSLDDARLVLAGRRGNSTPRIEAAITAAGVAEHVDVLGHRDDLPELMCAADLFVLPSRWEGLGGVLIEAMALEVPIIASDLAPVREVCDDGRCATLVEAGDVEALARAIEQLAGDPPARARLAEAGRARFEAHFTLDRSVEGMLAIFERARHRRNRRWWKSKKSKSKRSKSKR